MVRYIADMIMERDDIEWGKVNKYRCRSQNRGKTTKSASEMEKIHDQLLLRNFKKVLLTETSNE